MSGINEPAMTSIGTEDTEFYAEMLSGLSQISKTTIPSSLIPDIQNSDVALSQTLLDVVAQISLCRRDNVSATMASLTSNKGTLDTQLYIVFNHEDDESALQCSQHLGGIISLLRQVPYRSKTIARKLDTDFIEICKVIHNYSLHIFRYRVTKHMQKLSDIQGYIGQDQTNFSDEQRSMLLKFLEVVAWIIPKITTEEQLSTAFIKALVTIYSYWMQINLLPHDDNDLTLLDLADTWLAEKHGIGFQLRHWAVKIMSFITSANRLFLLTQSPRLRKIIDGNFSVKVLSSATARSTTHRCCLSSETIQVALDSAVAGTCHHLDDWDDYCKSFINKVLRNLKEPIDAGHLRPMVHAELAMIMAMDKGEIKVVFPYIGISKHSCTMCRHYIATFNEVFGQKIITKGSHEKAYPGWIWPSFYERNEELRRDFLERVKRQLLHDFEGYVERQLSDSRVMNGPVDWKKEIKPFLGH